MRTREIAKIGNILFQSVPLEETRRKLKIGQLQKDWIKIAGPAGLLTDGRGRHGLGSWAWGVSGVKTGHAVCTGWW